MSTQLVPPPQGNSAFATSLGILVLRLVLGWIFIYHGYPKLFGGMQGFTENIERMGMPVLPAVVWAYAAALAEFGGGILLMLGLLTRFATVPIIATMFVAIWKVHGPKGFSAPTGYEYNLALTAMAVTILLVGPGIVSLDALLFKRGLWSRGPQPLSQPSPR